MRKIRALRQEHDKIRAMYDKKIATLQEDLHHAQTSTSPRKPRSLKSVQQARIAELERQVEEMKGEKRVWGEEKEAWEMARLMQHGAGEEDEQHGEKSPEKTTHAHVRVTPQSYVKAQQRQSHDDSLHVKVLQEQLETKSKVGDA